MPSSLRSEKTMSIETTNKNNFSMGTHDQFAFYILKKGTALGTIRRKSISKNYKM